MSKHTIVLVSSWGWCSWNHIRANSSLLLFNSRLFLPSWGLGSFHRMCNRNTSGVCLCLCHLSLPNTAPKQSLCSWLCTDAICSLQLQVCHIGFIHLILLPSGKVLPWPHCMKIGYLRELGHILGSLVGPLSSPWGTLHSPSFCMWGLKWPTERSNFRWWFCGTAADLCPFPSSKALQHHWKFGLHRMGEHSGDNTEMGGWCEGSFPGYQEGLGRCHQEVAHLEMGAS